MRIHPDVLLFRSYDALLQKIVKIYMYDINSDGTELLQNNSYRKIFHYLKDEVTVGFKNRSHDNIEFQFYRNIKRKELLRIKILEMLY